jgi:RsiW-degrading membrane proteinase PrsW (M82 family)
MLLGLLAVLPLLALAPVWERDASGRLRSFWPGATALVGGAVGFAVTFALVELVRGRLGVEPSLKVDLVTTAFDVLVRGPLEETARALAVVLPLRSKRLTRPYDAMRLAAGASLGFGLADVVVRTIGRDQVDLWFLLGTWLYVGGRTSLSALWGFAIGRERRRRLGGRAFTRTFVVAVFFGGVVDHLVFQRGPLAISAVAPLVASSFVASLIARRDLLRLSEKVPKKRLSRFLRVRTPSIEELEAALARKPDRPILLRWVGFGALTTTGILVTSLVTSILLAKRAGVDFAAIDDGGAFDTALPPLVVLALAVLVSFPVSGFLVAKASSARSVLEPALASSIAIFLILVLMGLAAPIAVVFGLAVAPPAFALACGGAFLGLSRS